MEHTPLFVLFTSYLLLNAKTAGWIPITYIVGWYKTLYQVKPRVVIRLAHATGETSHKVLYQHIIFMYVINLSNISIKDNFKQITRVELNLTNLHNTLRETIFYAWLKFICYRSFRNDTLHTVHFQCHHVFKKVSQTQYIIVFLLFLACITRCGENGPRK